jgi:hypothetical protein
MENKIFYTSETIKGFIMIDTNFNLEEDLKKLNLNPSQEKDVEFIMKTYLDEMNYWKTKHETLLKKIKGIVCY